MKTENRQDPKPITPVMGAAITRSDEDRRQEQRRAEIRQRQRSMMNAMLCCMI